MANPMTAASLVTALGRWGLTVIEHPDWRTNNRNEKGAWGAVHGSIVHHTASTDGTSIVELCYNGRPDLRGPLCTGVIRKDGTVHLVGNGRANHAGTGGENVYQAVVSETAIPTRPGPDAVDGNAHFYGWEAVNLGDGKDPWPDIQVDAIARVQAAICEHHGWSAQSVIGHLEWTTRKIDPRGFSMAGMRARVAAHLAAGPTPMEDDMPLTDAEWKKLETIVKTASFTGVWNTDSIASPADLPDRETNPTWAAQSYLRSIYNHVRKVEAAEAAQTAAITTLANLVGSGVDTAVVVAAVQDAIAEAVVKVDVSVGSPTS